MKRECRFYPQEKGELATCFSDEGIRIGDNDTLTENVFNPLKPATDIYFSQGAIDGLKYSFGKMGFGTTMGIDEIKNV